MKKVVLLAVILLLAFLIVVPVAAKEEGSYQGEEPVEVDQDFLAYTAGVILSLAVAYVPGLADWYKGLDPTWKRIIMVILLALVSVGVGALACSPWTTKVFAQYVKFKCDEENLAQLAVVFFKAMVANQATFLLAPKGGGT